MENVYKTMRNIGAANIVMGIIIIVIGLVVGIITIVHGGKLLARKDDIVF